jgi:hypothetical protein
MAKIAQMFPLSVVVLLFLVGCVTFQETNMSKQAYSLSKAHWIGPDAAHLARLERLAKGFDLEVLSVTGLDMPERFAGVGNYFAVQVVNPKALSKPGSSTYNMYALVLRSSGTVDYLETDEDVRDFLNQTGQCNPSNLESILEVIRSFAQLRGYTCVAPLPDGSEIPEGVFQEKPSTFDDWSVEFRIEGHQALSVFATLLTISEFGVYDRYRFDVSSNGMFRVSSLGSVRQDATGFR